MKQRWHDLDISSGALVKIVFFFAGATVIASGLATWAILVGFDNKSDINVTQDVVAKVDSACARVANTNDPLTADVKECARIRRQADKDQPLADACISQKKTLKPKYYEIVTRCPRNLAAALEDDVTEGGSTEQEAPDIQDTVTPRGSIELPDGPADPPDPGPSDTPPSNPPSSNNPPVSPPVEQPPSGNTPPPSPPASAPTIQLPPVSVDLDDKACVGVGGLAAGLNC